MIGQKAVRQLGKGPFQSVLVTHRSRQANFASDRLNRAVSIGLALSACRIGFLFPRSANGEFRILGRNISTDKLIVFSGGAELEIFVPDLAVSESIGISTAKCETLFEALGLGQTLTESHQLSVIEGDAKEVRRLRSATLEAASGGLIAVDVQGIFPELLTEIIEKAQEGQTGLR